jgi:hypothetical protein
MEKLISAALPKLHSADLLSVLFGAKTTGRLG